MANKKASERDSCSEMMDGSGWKVTGREGRRERGSTHIQTLPFFYTVHFPRILWGLLFGKFHHCEKEADVSLDQVHKSVGKMWLCNAAVVMKVIIMMVVLLICAKCCRTLQFLVSLLWDLICDMMQTWSLTELVSFLYAHHVLQAFDQVSSHSSFQDCLYVLSYQCISSYQCTVVQDKFNKVNKSILKPNEPDEN